MGFATGLVSFCGAAGGFGDFATVVREAFCTDRPVPACARLAPRAGFRVEVRVFLVTRRDLAIGIAIRPAFL